MAIEWRVLGRAGADNALHAVVDTGQARDSFLFDCGEHCLDGLRTADIQAVSQLCFSHFHMDHVAGFDGFFRLNYNRADPPVEVWGPPGTLAIMEHRFLGFIWNLHADQPGEWIVREVDEAQIRAARFLTREAFVARRQPDRPRDSALLQRTANWSLEARLLPHGGVSSLAYRLVEPPRRNIDPVALRDLGEAPGPWLKAVADEARKDDETIELGSQSHKLGSLRERLLRSSPGDSLAWLTDFRVEPGTEAWSDLVAWLAGTDTLVCECQYRDLDSALAVKNAHMSASLVGRLAAEAGVGRLVLQHLSRRYTGAEWHELYLEVKNQFPRVELPRDWPVPY